MRLRRTLVLLSLALSTSAVPWEGPRPTTALEDANTSSSPPLPTPAPIRMIDQSYNDLKRQVLDPRFCGYISSSSESGWSCLPGRTCLFNTGYRAVGCCEGISASNCGLPTTCYPSTGIASLCTGSCLQNERVKKCENSEFPECETLTDASYTLYNCASTSGGTSSIFMPYLPHHVSQSIKEISGLISSISELIDDGTTKRVTVTMSGGGLSRQLVESSTSSTAPGPTDSLDVVPSKKKAPVGAIVGGVVGGLAVIALAVLGIFFLLRRNPKPSPQTAQVAGTYDQAQQQQFQGTWNQRPAMVHDNSGGSYYAQDLKNQGQQQPPQPPMMYGAPPQSPPPDPKHFSEMPGDQMQTQLQPQPQPQPAHYMHPDMPELGGGGGGGR